MAWATDLVTERKSDHDWMTFLRQQSKALMPWKDPDTPWQDLASSYRGIAEDVLRSPLEWSDKLLDQIGGEKGPRSAHEFELLVRSDERAWKEGTKLWDEGIDMVTRLQNVFAGVTF